ncbi:prelamin-A/C-like [Patiria miniata]|uniref:LTD domain-containing protein n=1 Tax=Patiria miniata TaxID=46514 RepID=A0A913ZPW8_PATMI|nr:prelamin-A/C-like [Patiria miniata]
MSGHVFPPAPMTRQQEKAELQHLNDRVQNYIAKVRKMREEANNIDSSALLNAMRVLEDEVAAIKSMYEKELANERRKVEDEMAGRNQAEVQAHRNKQLATDLQDRLSVENQRGRALADEIAALQRLCSQKDGDLQQARAKGEDLTRKLRDIEDDHAALQHHSADTQRRLDQETALRLEAQDVQQSLRNKIDFQDQLHAQELSEGRNRLDEKANHILQLEAKIRELSKPDNTLHEALQKVRDAAAAELLKYKEESEATYRKNLQELQDQMSRDADNIDKLSASNKHLAAQIEDLKNQIHSLQTKFVSTEQQNRNLTDQLSQEREGAAAHIRALEGKLCNMQDSLVQKMREITLATDAKQPVRAEIEALRALVEDEERKLMNITGDPIRRPVSLPAALRSNTPVTASRSPTLPRSTSPIKGYDNMTGMSSSVTQLSPRAIKRPASVPVSPMGQGKDYFDSMFGDLQKSTKVYPRLHPKSSPPVRLASTTHDYTTATSSTTGSIKILEVNEDGRFVRLFNTSPRDDLEIGGFMIQQNIGGHPVAVYRFPPRTRFRAGSTITVWSASSLAQHNPPTDLLWKEQNKWGTGPECTSILCKPNGQAIAWTTAAHRFTKTAKSYDTASESSGSRLDDTQDEDWGESQPHPEIEVEMNGRPVTALKREKEEFPSLSAAKHPSGQYPGSPTHPSTGQPRVKTLGNDNSSLCRQTRSQNSKPVPDVVGGVLYAGSGVGATRTGAAQLRKPMRTSPTKGMTSGSIRYSAQPSPFMSPHQEHYANLNSITASQRVSFQPPMPRPPVISSW